MGKRLYAVYQCEDYASMSPLCASIHVLRLLRTGALSAIFPCLLQSHPMYIGISYRVILP